MNTDTPAPAPQHAREDGSLRIRGRNILDMRLPANDLQAATIREYLCELLKIAWVNGTHFEVADPLVKLGMVTGTIADDGTVSDYDSRQVTDLIWEAIEVLSAEPFRPVGTKTATQRETARLQRRYGGKAR